MPCNLPLASNAHWPRWVWIQLVGRKYWWNSSEPWWSQCWGWLTTFPWSRLSQVKCSLCRNVVNGMQHITWRPPLHMPRDSRSRHVRCILLWFCSCEWWIVVGYICLLHICMAFLWWEVKGFRWRRTVWYEGRRGWRLYMCLLGTILLDAIRIINRSITALQHPVSLGSLPGMLHR